MVILFQRILPHYRIPFFNKLNSTLSDDLLVVYGQPQEEDFFMEEQDDEIQFKTLKVKNHWYFKGKILWQSIFKLLSLCQKENCVIIEHSPRYISIFPLLFYCKCRGIPVVLWGHGGSNKRDVSSSNSIKDRIHRMLIRIADAYICYTGDIRTKLSNVTDPNKLFSAQNTLDTDTLLKIRKQLETVGKQTIKEKLNLKRKRYIVHIGRLTSEKKVDYLIDLYENIKKDTDIGLLLIGDGPERKHLEQYSNEKQLSDIHFLGNISDWEMSGNYLFASDISVMPGCVGLSVNHCFCFGLPVITQMSSPGTPPFHGPEIAYILEGKTGRIVPHSENNTMVDVIKDVLANQNDYTCNIRTFTEENLSIDKMVEGFITSINYIRTTPSV